MLIRQFLFANPSVERAELPSRFDLTRRTTAQLAAHLLTKLADAAVVRLSKDPPEKRAPVASGVVPGNEPNNVSDQPHDRGMLQLQTAADSRLQSQLVRHEDAAIHLNTSFDWPL